MRFLPFQQLVVLSTLIFCSAALRLDAQLAYQGLIDGVYPARLIIEESNPKAVLSISSASSQLKFVGGCDLDKCKYRAIDTSLALVFDRSAEQVTGRIQAGDGNSKSFLLNRVDPSLPFESECGESLWLRSWADTENKHQLTLASLPGNRVKGTFFIRELGTGFSVSGTTTDKQLSLTLDERGSGTIGTIQSQVNKTQLDSRLIASLDLDGSKTIIEFVLEQEMPLTCMQTEGRFDVVHPQLEQTPYSAVPAKIWQKIAEQSELYGHAWFEPTLFNEHVLSGWMHVEGTSGRYSEPINLLREKNTFFKEKKILGGKRTKTQLISLHRDRAIVRHPLHSNKDFLAWANTLELSTFTLATEGIALSSERHPTYGQLQAIIPWRDMPKQESLPNWLSQAK